MNLQQCHISGIIKKELQRSKSQLADVPRRRVGHDLSTLKTSARVMYFGMDVCLSGHLTQNQSLRLI